MVVIVLALVTSAAVRGLSSVVLRLLCGRRGARSGLALVLICSIPKSTSLSHISSVPCSWHSRTLGVPVRMVQPAHVDPVDALHVAADAQRAVANEAGTPFCGEEVWRR